MKRALSPSTNPTGIAGTLFALWAGFWAIWNYVHHKTPFDPQVMVAAFGAAAALYQFFHVTPVKDPRDGAGVSLKTHSQFAAAQLSEVLARGGAVRAMPSAEPAMLLEFPGPLTQEIADALKGAKLVATLGDRLPEPAPPESPAGTTP